MNFNISENLIPVDLEYDIKTQLNILCHNSDIAVKDEKFITGIIFFSTFILQFLFLF